jgi:hypothetical protein
MPMLDVKKLRGYQAENDHKLTDSGAALSPPHGPGRAPIAPSHGTECPSPVPSHGAVSVVFRGPPVPSHGHHLEEPSALAVGVTAVGGRAAAVSI